MHFLALQSAFQTIKVHFLYRFLGNQSVYLMHFFGMQIVFLGYENAFFGLAKCISNIQSAFFVVLVG
jgi:hypothetical protein